MVDWSNLEVNTFRTAGSVFKKHPSATGKCLEITVFTVVSCPKWKILVPVTAI